jgi:protein TonB
MTVPVGPRIARDVPSAILAEIAPNAARLKEAYASHLGRALLVAVNLHLLALGAYWVASYTLYDTPAVVEPTGIEGTFLDPPPTPTPPIVDPAQPQPRGGPQTQAFGTGVTTLVPDEQADPDATTATQDEIAVSTRGPVTGVANAGDGTPDGPGTASALPSPPVIPLDPPDVPERVVEIPEVVTPPPYYEGVEVSPELIGGIVGLQARVEYPRFDREARNEGTVVVRFVVDENGVPSQVEVVRSVSAGLDRAAVDAVRAARFTPGVQNGRVVKVRMTLPVRFTIR